MRLRYWLTAPTVGEMLISLSLRTMIRRVLRWPMSLSASSEIPLIRAASPTTTATCSGPSRRSRASASPSATERPVPAWPPSMTSCSLSSRRGNPPSPPSWRSVSKRSCRPVSSLCAYAWCPVSQTMRSVGLVSTRCSATVSSTTPSELPRWPPVTATVSMMVERSSWHSTRASAWLMPSRSSGPWISRSVVMG